MLLHQLSTRFFHASRQVYARTEQSALATLRKKTGYTFSNCKKALEIHKNDVNLAEKWLNEQAQNLGWSKAIKLAERETAHGLIGVLIRGNIGAMVEINCETDFVAKNENFVKFVDKVTRLCAKYTDLTEFDGDLWRLGFEAEALQNLKCEDDKSLGDHLALLIGTVGENATIKRAVCYKTENDVQLAGYAHPASMFHMNSDNITQVGKYGAIVALRGEISDKQLHRNLCQHILGLNPKKVGELNKDQPVANKDDETCLIYQEYLADSEKTVGEVLEENALKVIDYKRFECGESLEQKPEK